MNTQVFLFSCCISMMFLSSCGSPNPSEESMSDTGGQVAKTLFTFEITPLEHLSQQIIKEKSATISASSSLTLNSESAGEVQNIAYKEGEFVKKGTILITLRDTFGNTDLAIAQAKNNLLLADANKNSSTINMDISIDAAQSAYDKAVIAYKNISEKTDLQYDNIMKANTDTLKTLNDTSATFLNEIDRMMTQQIYDADRLLGITENYHNSASGWQGYLDKYVKESYALMKKKFPEFQILHQSVQAQIKKDASFGEDEQKNKEALDFLTDAYSQMRDFSDSMVQMLQTLQNNTTEPFNSKGPTTTEQDVFLNTWTGYRGAISGSETQFITWKAETQKFLDNYQTQALATKLAVKKGTHTLRPEELNNIQKDSELKLAFNNLDTEIRTTISQAKIAVDQAQSALERAKKLKTATLQQIAVGKESSQISLQQAQRAASHLSVRAPIDGVITKVLIEKGQTVTLGAPMIEFSGNDPQVLTEIDPRIARVLNPGEVIQAKKDDGTLIDGIISAVSPIAGKNLLASTRISFPKQEAAIGKSVTLLFNIDGIIDTQNTYLFPLSIVNIVAENEGTISLYSGATLVSQAVQLGNMYGKNIEVIAPLAPDTKIITNDVSQYNPNLHTIHIVEK